MTNICIAKEMFDVQISNDENMCCIGFGVCNDTIAFVCPGVKTSFLHTFCKKHYELYIESLRGKRPICPVCKQIPIATTVLNPPERITNAVLSCDQCDWKGSYTNYNKHVDECLKSKIKCAYCDKILIKDQYDEHIEICDEVFVDCVHCNTTHARKNGDKHYPVECNHCKNAVYNCCLEKHYIQCEQITIDCPVGCGTKHKRCNLTTHIDENIAQHILLLNEKISTQKPQNTNQIVFNHSNVHSQSDSDSDSDRYISDG